MSGIKDWICFPTLCSFGCLCVPQPHPQKTFAYWRHGPQSALVEVGFFFLTGGTWLEVLRSQGYFHWMGSKRICHETPEQASKRELLGKDRSGSALPTVSLGSSLAM